VLKFWVEYIGVNEDVYHHNESILFDFIFPGKSAENEIPQDEIMEAMQGLFAAKPNARNMNACFTRLPFHALYFGSNEGIYNT